MTLSTSLKQLRTELNLAQKDLADILDTTAMTVNRWEMGRNKPQRAMKDKIIQLAEDKGVSKVCIDNLKESMLPAPIKSYTINDLHNTEISNINMLANESLNGILVVDMETCQILYANDKAVEVHNGDIDLIKGQTCYEELANRNKPCAFCKMKKLRRNKPIVWEYTSSRTGKRYKLREKVVEWGGKLAKVTYLSDITDSYELEKELERKEYLLQFATQRVKMRIFQFDIIKGCVYLISDYNIDKVFPSMYKNYPSSFIKAGFVADESKEDYVKMVEAIKEGQEKVDVDINLIGQDGVKIKTHYHMEIYDRNDLKEPQMAVCSVQVI